MNEVLVLAILAKYGIGSIIGLKTTDTKTFFVGRCRFFYDAAHKAFLIVDKDPDSQELGLMGFSHGLTSDRVTVVDNIQIESLDIAIPDTVLNALMALTPDPTLGYEILGTTFLP